MPAMVVPGDRNARGKGAQRISAAPGCLSIGRCNRVSDLRERTTVVLQPPQCDGLFLSIASYPQLEKRGHRAEQVSISELNHYRMKRTHGSIRQYFQAAAERDDGASSAVQAGIFYPAETHQWSFAPA